MSRLFISAVFGVIFMAVAQFVLTHTAIDYPYAPYVVGLIVFAILFFGSGGRLDVSR